MTTAAIPGGSLPTHIRSAPVLAFPPAQPKGTFAFTYPANPRLFLCSGGKNEFLEGGTDADKASQQKLDWLVNARAVLLAKEVEYADGAR